jgi:hypothetical protein
MPARTDGADWRARKALGEAREEAFSATTERAEKAASKRAAESDATPAMIRRAAGWRTVGEHSAKQRRRDGARR